MRTLRSLLYLIRNCFYLSLKIEPLARHVPLVAPVSEEELWEQPEAQPGPEHHEEIVDRNVYRRLAERFRSASS